VWTDTTDELSELLAMTSGFRLTPGLVTTVFECRIELLETLVEL
jgi:hypothetical protein